MTSYPNHCPKCGAQHRNYDVSNGTRYCNGDVEQVVYIRYACGAEYSHYRMLHADEEWGHSVKECDGTGILVC